MKNCVQALEKETNKKAFAVMSCEIGGTNALEPLYTAAWLGIPVVDADGMVFFFHFLFHSQ